MATLVAAIRDPVHRAGLPTVSGPEHLMTSARGVRREEDLVPAGARQPWPIALAAVDRPLRPRVAAVGGREQRVVDEVDARVVDPAALILREIGVREPGLTHRRRNEPARPVHAPPRPATVG